MYSRTQQSFQSFCQFGISLEILVKGCTRFFRTVGSNPFLLAKDMTKKREKKERPIISLNSEEREEVWDDLYIKAEGVVLEFDPDSNTGKIKSLTADGVYQIDSRELLRTRIELRPGDKVLFAPVEDASGTDYARVIRIVELKA